MVSVVGVITASTTFADDSSQSITVSNASPAVDSATISNSSYGSAATSVTLTENTTTTVYIHGTASDTNGCEEIDGASNYSLKMYRTNHASGASCTADNNDCYSASAATTVDQCTSGGSDTTSRYEFALNLQYWADPTDAGATQSATDWTAQVTASDDSAATGTGTDTVEIERVFKNPLPRT